MLQFSLESTTSDANSTVNIRAGPSDSPDMIHDEVTIKNQMPFIPILRYMLFTNSFVIEQKEQLRRNREMLQKEAEQFRLQQETLQREHQTFLEQYKSEMQRQQEEFKRERYSDYESHGR